MSDPIGPALSAFPPRRLHPSSPVLDLIVTARQWALPLVFLAFGSARALVFGPLFVLGVAAVVAWKVLAWSRFSYQLLDDVLVIEQGVLQKTRREVPLARIQQVDLRRRLRHRALGVAVVHIDTAGGGSAAKVSLEAIADDEAMALRSRLLRKVGTAVAEPLDHPLGHPDDPDGAAGVAAPTLPVEPPPAPVVVATLGTRDLAVAGLTGSRLTAGLAVGGALYGLFAQLPEGTAEDLGELLPSGLVAVVAGVISLIPLFLVFAVASSILTDHGFTLVRVGTDLHLRRGLFDQREATLSLQRVQAVRVHENLIRRAFGLASVQLQSAGGGTEAEGAVTRLTIPYLRRERLDALLAEVLPVAAGHPPLVPAPPAARRRAWWRATVPVLVVTAAVAILWREPAAALLLVLLLPAGAVAELAYRNLGHSGTPTVVAASSGGWVRETVLVPVAKAQSTRLTSSWFQRRVALATLHLDVAGRGGTPTVRDGDAARLDALRRTALDARAARADEAAVRRRVAASAG